VADAPRHRSGITQVSLAVARLVGGSPGPLTAAGFTGVGLMYLTGLLS
jgi:hypothetical protein